MVGLTSRACLLMEIKNIAVGKAVEQTHHSVVQVVEAPLSEPVQYAGWDAMVGALVNIQKSAISKVTDVSPRSE